MAVFKYPESFYEWPSEMDVGDTVYRLLGLTWNDTKTALDVKNDIETLFDTTQYWTMYAKLQTDVWGNYSDPRYANGIWNLLTFSYFDYIPVPQTYQMDDAINLVMKNWYKEHAQIGEDVDDPDATNGQPNPKKDPTEKTITFYVEGDGKITLEGEGVEISAGNSYPFFLTKEHPLNILLSRIEPTQVVHWGAVGSGFVFDGTIPSNWVMLGNNIHDVPITTGSPANVCFYFTADQFSNPPVVTYTLEVQHASYIDLLFNDEYVEHGTVLLTPTTNDGSVIGKAAWEVIQGDVSQLSSTNTLVITVTMTGDTKLKLTTWREFVVSTIAPEEGEIQLEATKVLEGSSVYIQYKGLDDGLYDFDHWELIKVGSHDSHIEGSADSTGTSVKVLGNVILSAVLTLRPPPPPEEPVPVIPPPVWVQPPSITPPTPVPTPPVGSGCDPSNYDDEYVPLGDLQDLLDQPKERNPWPRQRTRMPYEIARDGYNRAYMLPPKLRSYRGTAMLMMGLGRAFTAVSGHSMYTLRRPPKTDSRATVLLTDKTGVTYGFIYPHPIEDAQCPVSIREEGKLVVKGYCFYRSHCLYEV